MRGTLFLLLTCGMLLVQTGCSLVLPEISNIPVIRNPFPQLSKVAVAPFFNQSDEPTVDGRAIAMAYFAELQDTPGFEVVPVGVVEEAIIMHRVELGGPGEARRLAQLLGVDAVIVGAVTDYSPYYPPRLGLRVEWYTANPGYHEIPAGYGLPWHTPDEEFIPDDLVYEAKMSVARTQLATQSPACDEMCQPLPTPPLKAPEPATPPQDSEKTYELESEEAELEEESNASVWNELRLVQATEELPPTAPTPAANESRNSAPDDTSDASLTTNSFDTTSTMPLTGPTDSCFAPPLPQGERPACLPHNGPVLVHTQIYRGTDRDMTEALKGYVYHRDDARFGGWEAYLQRSDDFVRFCCHMHISEMLSARGGARKTRVLWRWPESR
ncbi:MAG: hypothetical protein SH868_16810 [Bythopirellula sp.]|nr:hypothetical protein [Bythopirellula sp.]